MGYLVGCDPPQLLTQCRGPQDRKQVITSIVGSNGMGEGVNGKVSSLLGLQGSHWLGSHIGGGVVWLVNGFPEDMVRLLPIHPLPLILYTCDTNDPVCLLY